MNLASFITLLRIILILPIIYLTSKESLFLNWVALLLFLIAGMTDYLDGYIARKTNTESSLGALLDLLADKLLVCIVLIWLVYIADSFLLIYPVMIIISRELIVSSFRQFIVEKRGNNPVNVSYIAKSKTTLQFVGISFLIISPGFGSLFNGFTIILVWVAALISIYSLMKYVSEYKKII
tara:strand:- start:70 stop:609 length:540 start_codon:yes stop_codon:yes gene_type:complete